MPGSPQHCPKVYLVLSDLAGQTGWFTILASAMLFPRAEILKRPKLWLRKASHAPGPGLSPQHSASPAPPLSGPELVPAAFVPPLLS